MVVFSRFTRLILMGCYIVYISRTWSPGIPFFFFIFYSTLAPAYARQNLPHEFSDAQISQHCNKRKLADIARRERDISRYLFASAPHHYRKFAEPARLTTF